MYILFEGSLRRLVNNSFCTQEQETETTHYFLAFAFFLPASALYFLDNLTIKDKMQITRLQKNKTMALLLTRHVKLSQTKPMLFNLLPNHQGFSVEMKTSVKMDVWVLIVFGSLVSRVP